MRGGFDGMNEAQSAPPARALVLQRGLRATARRLLRAGALCAVTLALACAWFAAWPLMRMLPRFARRWRRVIFRSWARSALWICRIETRVAGGLPERPCYLVANHLGYVDILVIAAHVDATFVSMKELEGWPFFGLMARQFGTVFVDRSQKRAIPDVNRAIELAFERCDAVVIFPEGRHTRGAGVLPFRPALLEPAARDGHPVAWAVLHYSTASADPPASQAIPWVDVPFLRQARLLLALERVEARLVFGADVVRQADRKELARLLHERVSAAFVPLQ